MENGKIIIRPRELICAIFIFLMPLSLYLEINFRVPLVAYSDEILCVISILFILYYSLFHSLKGKSLVFLLLIVIVTVIGFAGNLFSEVITNYFPILIDAIAFLKLFVPFLVYHVIAIYDKDHFIFRYLVPFSKFLILSGSFFGLISLFVNIGMSGEKRYGIRSYNFVFGNTGGGSRYGFMLFCCLLILATTNIPLKKYRIYEILVIFNIIIITKGASMVLAVCYIVLVLMWRYSKTYKFTVSNVVGIAIAGIGFSSYQINTYLRDQESPRMRLIRYGAVTANTYFPLGSGFATYASDQANKNYSPLYYEYGFHKKFGMSPGNTSFLNDGYIGMVIGEFGWIGAILFVALIVIVFIYINKSGILGKHAKALTIAIYISLIISTLGTAIIKSNIGVMCFSVLGVISGYSYSAELKKEKSSNST